MSASARSDEDAGRGCWPVTDFHEEWYSVARRRCLVGGISSLRIA
jgi:hypothetical protein